jgi:hypothetical protein
MPPNVPTAPGAATGPASPIADQQRGTANRGTSDRGVVRLPQLVGRCRDYQMKSVPSRYSQFEDEVVGWISTCVQSRGLSAHREEALVRGNVSLRALYAALIPGQPARIVPDYRWNPNLQRVEHIAFSSAAATLSKGVTPPPQNRPTRQPATLQNAALGNAFGFPRPGPASGLAPPTLRPPPNPPFEGDWDPNSALPPANPALQAAIAAQTQEQAKAESLMRELLPHFRTAFAEKGKVLNSRIGKPVRIKVLREAEWKAKEREQLTAEHEQDLRALLRYRPVLVRDKLDRAERQDLLSQTYPRQIRPDTVIAPPDQPFVLTRTSRPSKAGAGFYFSVDNTLYILSGQVGVEIIAHEMCHAYASPQWNEAQIEMTAFGLLAEANKLDEAVTSELATLPLGDWQSAKGKRMPGERSPSGYVGYGTPHQNQGYDFLKAVEGGGTAGKTTKAAYFGGKVRLKINENALLESTMLLDGKNFELSDLFSK